MPLIITNNADQKFCIPESITMGTSEGFSDDEYGINESTLNNEHLINGQTPLIL